MKEVSFTKFIKVGEDVEKLTKSNENKQKLNILRLILLAILTSYIAHIIGVEKVVIILLFIALCVIILSKYEVITYALALYPFIDYALRTAMPSVAGIWDELLFVAMFMVWIYKYIRYRKEESFKVSPIDLPIIIFLAIMIIMFVINSPDHRIGLEGLRAVVQYILWYFVVLQLLKDKKSAKMLCLVFVLVISVIAMHGVFQYIIGVDMPSNWVDSKEAGVRTRVFSILTSPNILGSLITLALPLCLSFINIFKKIKTKFVFSFFALMMLGTLMFTFSRGAWIGFAFAIAMYVFLKDKRLFIPVIILGVLAIFLVPGIFDRISYMLSEEYITSSLRGGRLIRWITGLKILSNSPIMGVGLGHFGGAVAMNHELFYLVGLDPTKTFYMDNYYLKMAVETGIVGLIAFVSLMYQIIINGARTIRITKDKMSRELEIGIISGLFGVIIHNFVENVFEVPMMSSCFWLLVAVLMHFWYINYHNK